MTDPAPTTALPRIAVAPGIAVEPGAPAWVHDEVRAGGGTIMDAADADGVVWMSPGNPGELRAFLAASPRSRWVQLPFAGVEAFLEGGVDIDDGRTWTCGKGVYAQSVAEHAMALMLAGLRMLPTRLRATSWAPQGGRTLEGSEVLILGGGGITESLVAMLAPFGARVTVLRKRPGATPIPHDPPQFDIDQLHARLPTALVVVIALALTAETERIIDAEALHRMRPDAWIVNVGRGRHIDTDALVSALMAGRIGGAGLDVTEPEPLPDDHPLWRAPNCIITPHTANTAEMARGPLGRRIRENVARLATGQPLVGRIDPGLGY